MEYDMVTMLKTMKYTFMALAVMLIASPAFAQGGETTSPYTPLAAGLGMALAAGLCGLGQGRATGSAVEAIARNPGARPAIFTSLILGLALIESLALFTFVIIFLYVK